MTAHPRPRLRRLATLLPAILSAVLGTCVAVTVASAPSPASAPPAMRPALYSDGNPLGGLNLIGLYPGGLHVRGWTFDPDVPHSSVIAYARIDGKAIKSSQLATLDRPDVAQHYPSAGALHGFDWAIPVPEGLHTVCVRGYNIGRGTNQTIGCRTANFYYGPLGALESLTAAAGRVRVSGWTLDGDRMHSSLSVSVSVDGTAHTIVADALRTDIAALHPNTGSNHGFVASFPVAQGTHRVCVTAHNIGYGEDTSFGCKTVTLDEQPLGGINVPQQVSGKLRVWGWAFDPDSPRTPTKVTVRVDSGRPVTLLADHSRPDVARVYPAAGAVHGFDTTFTLKEGTHSVCVIALNISYGSDHNLNCKPGVLHFTPTASLTTATPTRTGIAVTGWASDPDTTAPISTHLLLDGHTVAAVTANGTGGTHSGHAFATTLQTTSGTHVVCAVGMNVLWGSHNSTASCRTVTLALRPFGYYDSLTRAPGSTNLALRGWAIDPDTSAPISIVATVDGKAAATLTARSIRTDVERAHPGYGSDHGLDSVVASDGGEHTVCLTAKNVGGGSDTSLGCKLIIAVHPVAPGVPGHVTAVAGYGGATVTWQPPAFDGGAPVSGYTVTATPGNISVSTSAAARTATVTGLNAGTRYSFAVRAVNQIGASAGASSPTVTTQAGPPAQRTPAPVSTSRYIRNVRGSSAAERATMRAEGATDAGYDPSGHGYLILLDIGGQDAYDNGVVLSATTRFVTYRDLVSDIEAYLDGYHSRQQASAPVIVAIGTNNDMDVSSTTGRGWATQVINPLAAHAARYTGMTVAGANDIEPGFRASYSQTRSWLLGYLGATEAPFVFNGSADGCAWTTTNRSCNNGWTMAGLNYLTVGAAPVQMLNLPQVYNTTMAAQWKYISLTGVVNHGPPINFAGVLTEYTACSQGGGCGSLTGHTAWSQLWNDLQSDARLRVSSLPYSTDLRIDW